MKYTIKTFKAQFPDDADAVICISFASVVCSYTASCVIARLPETAHIHARDAAHYAVYAGRSRYQENLSKFRKQLCNLILQEIETDAYKEAILKGDKE